MYQLTADPHTILRTSDGVFIPCADDNPAYHAYLEWKAEGNEPEAAPTLPEPPQLTPLERLARLGLSADDLRSILDSP